MPPPSPIYVPSTALTGLRWPALASDTDATLLAVLHQLQYTEWQAWPRIEAAQAKQLSSLLNHAREHVPFYRDRLPGSAASAGADRIADLLAGVAVIQRGTVQSAEKTLQATVLPKGHSPLRPVSTSGSTGRPLTVQTSYITWLIGSALNMRFHFWHKRDLGARVANIRVVRDQQKAALADQKPGKWTFGYPSGGVYLYDLTEPAGRQLDWLRELAPGYLLTHPSNVRALIEASQSRGGPPPGLREVITMSEALDDDLRDLCQSAWGVPLTDGYTAQETGPIAFQCPQHDHYHVMSESLVVEVLDDQDRPCGPGETGRVVLTTLANFASPLIRYEIGDYAEVGAPCPCGRGLPVLTRIMGRSRNLLILPDGTRIWPRMSLSGIRAIAPVEQVQMVQTDRKTLELRVVGDSPLAEPDIAALHAYIAKNFHADFTVHVNQVAAIPRSASGKYEDFMSLIA